MFGIERQPSGPDLRHKIFLGLSLGFSCNDNQTTPGPRSGSKKAGRPDPWILTSTIGRHNEGRILMLRTILAATAALCLSQAASAQEMTAEQRSACMGDYEKFCKSVAPGGGRIIACLAKESDKITPACKKVLAAAEKK
jgi:hypothetical protein